jgi:hypothetical protein
MGKIIERCAGIDIGKRFLLCCVLTGAAHEEPAVKELKEELRQRWHESVAELGRWLRSVVQGYFNYHAVPGISPARDAFGWK